MISNEVTNREYPNGRASRKRRCAVFLLILLLFFSFACCNCFKSPTEESIATVNGSKITVKDFNVKFRNALTLLGDKSSPLKASEIESLKGKVLDDLIDEKVMLKRAEKLGLKVTDEELLKKVEEIKKDYSNDSFNQMFGSEKVDYKIWSEELKKRLLLEKLVNQEVGSMITVSDEESLSYYQTHKNNYYSEESVHVAQIAVGDKKKAETILERLKKGEDFAKLAMEFSTGPEAAKGGDLGIFSRGVMPEAFDKVVFSLPVGKVSRVVKSPYGYHIFKVLNKEAKGWTKYEDVKEKIIAELKKGKEEQVYRKWLESLRSEAQIKINETLLGELKPE